MVSPVVAMMMATLSGWWAACVPGCIGVPLRSMVGPNGSRSPRGSRPARRPAPVPLPPMDATERFTELLGGSEPDAALDEGALLIAAHAYPGLDIDRELARLDDLA